MELLDPVIFKKVESVFMPYLARHKDALKDSGNKFVHYTSAENAINIIKTKQFWMRSPSCMNDYMEITHGYDQLLKFFEPNGKHRQTFIKTLDLYEEGIALEILKAFDDWWEKIEHDTFISSISVHSVNEEDNHGRLSMWRGYGEQQAKAAIVLNKPPEPEPGQNSSIILSPALYFTYKDLEKEILLIIENIQENIDFIKSLDRLTVLGTMVTTLISFAVCLKHAGFKEEKEWRIIHLPRLLPSGGMLKREVETIHGIPQIVFKIPLDDYQEQNILNIPFTDLIDKIIIGPTQYKLALYDAFADALHQSGIDDVSGKIITSHIPLRT